MNAEMLGVIAGLLLLFCSDTKGGDGSFVDKGISSFIKEGLVSVGHSDWKVITSISLKDLRAQDIGIWKAISGAEKFYFVQAYKSKGSLHVQRKQRYLQLINDAKISAKRSTDIVQHIEYFVTGASKEEETRTKRFIPAALGIPLLGSVLDIGSAGINLVSKLIGVKQDPEIFNQRFEVLHKDVDKNTRDMYTFKKEQYSFNLKVKKHQRTVNENINKIQDDMTDMETYDELMAVVYQINFASQQLYDYVNMALEGAILAARGIPSLPYMEPKVLATVIDQFEEVEIFERSYFKKSDISVLYQLVKPRVLVTGSHLTVVSYIQLPTMNTVGNLYSLQAYPIYDEKLKKFVQLDTANNSQTLIAVNRNSDYMEFNNFEIHACDKQTSIILCSSSKLWKNVENPTCIGAIYFENQKQVATQCNFITRDIKELAPEPVHVANGVYHFAVSRKTQISYNCGEKGTQIESLEGNGFISADNQCNIAFQGCIIRNNIEYAEKNRTFVVNKSFSFLDFDEISEEKLSMINKTLRTKLTEHQENGFVNTKQILELAEDISERNFIMDEIETSNNFQMEKVKQLENEVKQLENEIKGNNLIFRSILISVTGIIFLGGLFFIGRQRYFQRKYLAVIGNNPRDEEIAMGPVQIPCGGWVPRAP